MDDLTAFLPIVAFIAFFIIRSYRIAMRSEKDVDENPLPEEVEAWPKDVKMEPVYEKPLTSRLAEYKREKSKKQQKLSAFREGERTTRSEIEKTAEETPSEFTISDADTARKAIIWGEIMNRKY